MKVWKNNIRKVEPYVPGEQPDAEGMIKLNTNENPYPPAPGVEMAINNMTAEDVAKLRLYPDPDSKELIGELARFYGLDENQLYVGVGSDDVLALVFLTFFNSEKPILFPDITYSFYDVWADLFRIPYERPAVDGDFCIQREDYYKENGGIVIANPNAPTGIYEDLGFVRDILNHNQDVIVVIDEAYIDFGGTSAMELIEEYDNLLIVQTFSKSRSMAGMRIGFAAGNPELICALNDVRCSYNSYPMTRMTTMLGVEAVKDRTYFEATIEKIINTRERVKVELAKMGFSFPDSKTNFLFVRHESEDANVIFAKLREKNIFVRHFSAPRIDNYLRITIGTDEEMDVFLDELKKLLNYQKNG